MAKTHFNTEIIWDMELKDFISQFLPYYVKDMTEKEAKALLKKKYYELKRVERKDTKSKPRKGV